MFGFLYYLFIFVVSVLFVAYILVRWTCGRCFSNVCLIGKTIIVTGGNSGIGYELCLNLASRGCNVIIADKDNAEETVKKIKCITQNPNIIYKHLDLASFKSIKEFSNDIIENYSQLDVLINNAGIGSGGGKKTEDGYDLTLQVNHYGPFLLSYCLLDLLKKSAPSRIVFTSSILTFYTRNFNIETLKNENNDKYTYCDSKMCQLIVARELAKRLRPFNIFVNAVHPGIVKTPIYKETWKNIKNLLFLEKLLAQFLVYFYGKNSEEGCQTTLYAAIDKEIEKKNIYGEFLWDCTPFYLPHHAKDETLCRKVYDYSEKVIKASINP